MVLITLSISLKLWLILIGIEPATTGASLARQAPEPFKRACVIHQRLHRHKQKPADISVNSISRFSYDLYSVLCNVLDGNFQHLFFCFFFKLMFLHIEEVNGSFC